MSGDHHEILTTNAKIADHRRIATPAFAPLLREKAPIPGINTWFRLMLPIQVRAPEA
jgi:hypothetical protein